METYIAHTLGMLAYKAAIDKSQDYSNEIKSLLHVLRILYWENIKSYEVCEEAVIDILCGSLSAECFDNADDCGNYILKCIEE